MNSEFESKNIVFYDGDCGFCNASVQFILKKRKKDIYFIPLQSDKAKKVLGQFDIEIQLDTFYYLKGKRLFDKSSAALQVSRDLKHFYPLSFGLYIIPKFLRDIVYLFVAKRRHKINNGFCVLPTETEKKFFLS